MLSGYGIRTAPEQTRLIEGRHVEPAEACEKARQQFYNVDLCAIVAHTLESDPRDRYRSVEALVSDLERWKRGFPILARPPSTLYRLECWIGRHTSLAVSGLVVVVALVGGLSLALWQADRAERSAVVAESAQQRAESINRFLLDLFEAEIPDLPPDEMPTTRQLVEQGIERARSPDAGPPELRAELLVTLAEILLTRRDLEQAESLFREARSLVGEVPDTELGVRFALFEVELARLRNEFVVMESALERAESLLERVRPDSLERLEMQRDRGRLYMRREQPERAEEILLEVQQAARGRDDSDDLLLRLSGDLAVVAGWMGRPRVAIERFEEKLRLKRERDDSPLSLATTLVNIAGLRAGLGDYEPAETGYRQVLDLLEPFDVPQGTRATSLKGLADLHRWRGEFAEAERLIHESAEEWRRVLNLEAVEDDFFIHYYLAELHDDAGRFEQAAERMERAIERMSAGQEAPPMRIAEARARLARYRCEQGRPEAATEALVVAREAFGERRPAPLIEAEVVCDLAAGQVVEPDRVGPELIEEALDEPGEINAIARLETLRADVLSRAGRGAEALALVESATARLREKAVSEGHPLLARLEQLRDRIGEPMAGANGAG
jgi:tetratricopeptide (TPR) repeat protein